MHLQIKWCPSVTLVGINTINTYLLMNQISLTQYERGHRFTKKFINGSKNNRHSNFIETKSYTTITWAIATIKQLTNLFKVPRYVIPSNEAFCWKCSQQKTRHHCKATEGMESGSQCGRVKFNFIFKDLLLCKQNFQGLKRNLLG